MTGVTEKQKKYKNMFHFYANGFSNISVIVEVLKRRKSYTAINTYKNGVSLLSTGFPVFEPSSNNIMYVICIARNISELINQRNFIENRDKDYSLLPDAKLTSNTEKLKYLINRVDVLANPNVPILILGETGVGKDYFAKMLHDFVYSEPNKHPFIKVNCGAIPESLLESELFGYEKGAFTGASDRGKKGLVEIADNGTLFLDEIGELPYPMQVKLLSVVEDRELTRVGGAEKTKVKIKIIAATNADLLKMTMESGFRLDLYYRLSLITLKLPPLRERTEDIPDLVINILREINKKYEKNAYFSLEVINVFLQYDWPGNIRELKNVIEKLVLFSPNERITLADLILASNYLGGDSEKELLALASIHSEIAAGAGLQEWLEIYEKNIIKCAVATSGTLKEVAEKLNIDISTLVRKKKKYNI